MILDYEHFGQETNLALPNWNISDLFGSVSGPGEGPFGIGRYYYSSNPSGRNIGFTNQTTVYYNLHAYIASVNYEDFLILYEGTSQQIKIGRDNTGLLTAYRGGTALGNSGTRLIHISDWYFIQLRVVIHPSAGSIELRIQGAPWITLTGINTVATANAWVNGWGVGGHVRYTNVVIYNESGDEPIIWTPETMIYSDRPSGPGSLTDFTPSAAPNWGCLDEVPNNGDTDYVLAAAAPASDLYACPAALVPAGSIVYGVGVELDARKDDAGVNDLAALLKSGVTTAQGASTFNLTSVYARYRQVWTQDPNTAAPFTVAAANAVEIGQRRTA